MSVAGRKPSISAASADPAPYVRTGQVDSLPIEPPEELSPDAARAWAVLLPDLISTGVFSVSDTFLLFELCETLASAQSFRREVRQLQRRLEAADDELDHDLAEKISSRLKRARAGYLQHMKLTMSISGEFGISPVARLRLGLMKVQGASLLSALMSDDE